ncbi:MAG: NAD(P)H-dependent amine dehydrogenase family protein [Solimonas sp.]
MKRYRVLQYATGGVGKHAIAGIAAHPQLELAGLLVHSADKDGQDAGTLAGIAPLGVRAICDIDEALRMDVDCVSYMALWPDVDLICRFLESGKNVVTTSGLLYPKFFGPELVARLDAACMRGGSSVHGTGINPGFSGEVLPLTMSVLSRRIEQIVVQEFADFRTYNSPELNHDMLGFGRTVEHMRAHKHPNFDLMMQFFHQSIAMVADGLGVPLERIDQREEYGITPGGTIIESGAVPPGTIGGIKTRFEGIVAGRPMLVIQLVWVATYDLGPGWPQAADASNHTQWSVTIEGEPSLRCTFEQAASFERPDADGSHTAPAMICTAMHAVNAIPYVCEAAPGIRTFLDLPLLAGRYAMR